MVKENRILEKILVKQQRLAVAGSKASGRRGSADPGSSALSHQDMKVRSRQL